MPKVNTFNYDTIASWNGSQDLFVVEQPDGTKVATPAMVKQFIEAGDFEATGEVKDGHGNILKDMAKSADVNTALAGKQNTLTFDNAPTASSNNPVKSGGIKTYVDNAVATATTWTDISSQCTVDTTRVQAFKAYTCGKIIYISITLKAGVTDQTNIITGLPQVVGYGVLPMFWMNAVDSTSNGVCLYAGTVIQYRGSATQGTGGTQYSGMFLLE